MALVASPLVQKQYAEAERRYNDVVTAAAISNAYYPPSNRGLGLFLTNFLIDTGQRAAANFAQEFILRRFTHKAKNRGRRNAKCPPARKKLRELMRGITSGPDLQINF